MRPDLAAPGGLARLGQAVGAVLARVGGEVVVTLNPAGALVAAAGVAAAQSGHRWAPLDQLGPGGERAVVVADALPPWKELRAAIAQVEQLGHEVCGVVAVSDRDEARLARALGYRVEVIGDGPAAVPMAPAAVRPPRSCPDDVAGPLAARIQSLAARTLAPRGPEPAGVCVIARIRDDDAEVARAWARGAWSSHALAADLWEGLRSAPWCMPGDLVLEVHALSAPLPIIPAQLDCGRFAIGVRVPGRPALGLALPDEPGVAHEVEQLALAVSRTGGERADVLTELVRFDVASAREENDITEPSWEQEAVSVVERLVPVVARAVAAGQDPSALLPASLEGYQCPGLAVTVYSEWGLGCWTSWRGTLGERLDRALASALDDKRLGDKRLGGSTPLVVSVTLLGPGRSFTGSGRAFAAHVRLGVDAVSVRQGPRFGVLLEGVPVLRSWDRATLVAALAEKAGLARGDAWWTTHPSVTAVQAGGAVRPTHSGYPARVGPPPPVDDDIDALAGYIERRIPEGGVLPMYWWSPTAPVRRSGSLVRRLYALDALGQAGRRLDVPRYRKAAERGAIACLESLSWVGGRPGLEIEGDRADAYALVALLRLAVDGGHDEPVAARLAEFLAGWLLRDDGRVADPSRVRANEDHDYLPGAALHALGLWGVGGLGARLNWYAARAAQVKTWGMASWLPLACETLFGLGATTEPALAFELADWALDRQLATTGSFLTDVSPGVPSFHTACTAEGVAAAWRLAQAVGDGDRAARYADSWARATAFMGTLVIRAEDGYQLHDPSAVGGVRLCVQSSDVRIDFVGHALFSLLGGAAALDAGPG
jgi:hypothetical protein